MAPDLQLASLRFTECGLTQTYQLFCLGERSTCPTRSVGVKVGGSHGKGEKSGDNGGNMGKAAIMNGQSRSCLEV